MRFYNSTLCFIVHSIKRKVRFYKQIIDCILSAFFTTKTYMFFILFSSSNQTCITWTIATIFTIISLLPRINTFSNSCVSMFIPYLLRNSIIKYIEISKPISIIVTIDIFYYSSIKLVDIFESSFLKHYSRFFTSNPSCTVGNHHFISKYFFVFLDIFF